MEMTDIQAIVAVVAALVGIYQYMKAKNAKGEYETVKQNGTGVIAEAAEMLRTVQFAARNGTLTAPGTHATLDKDIGGILDHMAALGPGVATILMDIKSQVGNAEESK